MNNKAVKLELSTQAIRFANSILAEVANNYSRDLPTAAAELLKETLRNLSKMELEVRRSHHTGAEKQMNTDIYSKLINNHYASKLPFARSRTDPRAYAAFRADVQRLEAEFKADALAEVGLTNNPKAEIAWSIAWDERHASGYREVLDFLITLSELFK